MDKLLIADDEFHIRELIKKYAQHEGYEVFEVDNGADAVEMCKKDSFDLIIMDVMMPKTDGFEAAKAIRKENVYTPIIMLSARGEEYDRINGFEIGVDDYVVKPFSPKELMMRIRAVLKRTKANDTAHADIFIYKGLKVDFAARVVTIDNERVNMTPREYDLLFYMIRNQGIALSREQLISHVWGYDFFGDDRTLDTHIKLLRKSLKNYANMIVTLRGVGYRFEIPKT